MDPRLQRQKQQAQQLQPLPVSQINTVPQKQEPYNQDTKQEKALDSKKKAPEISGPLKRNQYLQEPEVDCFQPRFKLEYELPEIPVRPKLFKYRLDTADLASQYQFSSVELNQEHPILVDYNMGARIDLIDRQVYSLPQGENAKKAAEDLNERDRFLLSAKDSLPMPVMHKQSTYDQAKDEASKHAKLLREQLLKSEAIDEANLEGEGFQNIVFSGAVGIKVQEKAKQQIEKTFEQVKQFTVGCKKLDHRTGERTEVTAVSVSQILPCIQAELVSQFQIVVNEDDIGLAIQNSQQANGFLIHSYTERDGEDWKALYAQAQVQEIPLNIREKVLGKRAHHQQQAIQHSFVRDYTFSEFIGGTKGEKFDYVLQKQTDGSLRYIPISSKIKLNKKRKINVENEVGETKSSKQVTHIVVAPRALSVEDQKHIQSRIAESATTLRFSDINVIFGSKEQLADVEREAASSLKVAFKEIAREDDNPNPDPVQNWNMEEDELYAMSQNQEVKAEAAEMSEDEIF